MTKCINVVTASLSHSRTTRGRVSRVVRWRHASVGMSQRAPQRHTLHGLCTADRSYNKKTYILSNISNISRRIPQNKLKKYQKYFMIT